MGYNLQDIFLNQLRREQMSVAVLLMTGETLEGMVKGFDNFTVVLENSKGEQRLLYKHAIASLTPQRALPLPLPQNS